MTLSSAVWTNFARKASKTPNKQLTLSFVFTGGETQMSKTGWKWPELNCPHSLVTKVTEVTEVVPASRSVGGWWWHQRPYHQTPSAAFSPPPALRDSATSTAPSHLPPTLSHHHIQVSMRSFLWLSKISLAVWITTRCTEHLKLSGTS